MHQFLLHFVVLHYRKSQVQAHSLQVHQTGSHYEILLELLGFIPHAANKSYEQSKGAFDSLITFSHVTPSRIAVFFQDVANVLLESYQGKCGNDHGLQRLSSWWGKE